MSKTARAASNLAMLEFVARKLGKLKDQFIFVGGCTTALFMTDPAAPDIRSTIDVDCIVDVASLVQYHKIERALQKLGFKKSLVEEVICRWYFDDAILDVMPTDEKILGFSNYWYKAALYSAISYQLTEDLTIRSVTPPYFLATKMEAFHGRGHGDFFASHDFEDMMTVIDGRPEIIEEIRDSDELLKKYLAEKFGYILENPQFQAALPGHLNYGSLAAERAEIVLNRIENLTRVGA